MRVRADALVQPTRDCGVRRRDLAAEGVVAATPRSGDTHARVYLDDGVRSIPIDALEVIGPPPGTVPRAGECWRVALDSGACHVRVVERVHGGYRVSLAGIPTVSTVEQFLRRVPSGEGHP